MAESQVKPAPCPACDGKGYTEHAKGMSPLYCFACEGTGRAGAGVTHVVRYRRGSKVAVKWQAHG